MVVFFPNLDYSFIKDNKGENMKYVLIIISAMFLVACGQKQKTEFRVDPALMPYYEKFVQESLERGRNSSTNDLIMEFGSTEGRVLGYCQKQEKFNFKFLYTETVSTPVVVINPTVWKNMAHDEAGRRELIYHELGHCILNKDHDTTRSAYGRPESIMYPYHMGGSWFATWENNYLDQLFGLRLFAISEPDGSPATAIASTASESFDGIRTKTYTSTLDGCLDHEHFEEETDTQEHPESEIETIEE